MKIGFVRLQNTVHSVSTLPATQNKKIDVRIKELIEPKNRWKRRKELRNDLGNFCGSLARSGTTTDDSHCTLQAQPELANSVKSLVNVMLKEILGSKS